MENKESTARGVRLLSMPKVISILSLARNNVTNAVGDDLGKVEDVMVDLKTARISFVVISSGSSLLRNNLFYAVPWEALEVSLHDKRLILNVSKETMSNAPSFDKNSWPDMSDLTWMNDINAYYGLGPAVTTEASSPTSFTGRPDSSSGGGI